MHIAFLNGVIVNVISPSHDVSSKQSVMSTDLVFCLLVIKTVTFVLYVVVGNVTFFHYLLCALIQLV